MPKVACVSKDVDILIANERFQFKDGSRQVTEAEAEVLARFSAEGGPKITIEEAPADSGGK